ncbi:hypothetical protein RCL1_002052 [Eukaryota sp. TZLM3-RCL]
MTEARLLFRVQSIRDSLMFDFALPTNVTFSDFLNSVKSKFKVSSCYFSAVDTKGTIVLLKTESSFNRLITDHVALYPDLMVPIKLTIQKMNHCSFQ